jgi:hypothetical protein
MRAAIVVDSEMLPFAKKASEHPRCCAAHGRVARRVFPMRGRREERHPRRIRTCGRVAVGVGERDRGDWPPENVMVFFASQHAMAASAIAISARKPRSYGAPFPQSNAENKALCWLCLVVSLSSTDRWFLSIPLYGFACRLRRLPGRRCLALLRQLLQLQQQERIALKSTV